MAFSSEKKARSIAGSLVIEVHSWNAASVTTGDISTGIAHVLSAVIQNEVTEGQGIVARDGQKVTLSGLTSNDTGTLIVVGY